MSRQGFIFSLDAFVAFTLITIAIGLLIFTIGTPKPFYPELEQAHQLAYDTLQALATSSDGIGGQTYLEKILANEGSASAIMPKVAGGARNYTGIIPDGFGYALQKGIVDNEGKIGWGDIYDSKGDSASDRSGKSFTKLRASATIFTSAYTIAKITGKSPYCYISCFGYNGTENGIEKNASPCDVTPCSAPKSFFNAGENSVQIVRLVVYT